MSGDTTSTLPRVSVEHIVVDEKGYARIAGHRIKVMHLVQAQRALDYSAEQLQREAYPHLSLAQIYAALAFYHDHQAEIDEQIRASDAFADEMRAKMEPDNREIIDKLRARAKKK
jgi:uncharacterized protein (DUF433 family)